MKNSKSYKNSSGITLVALVVTIIVLLILATISIMSLMGDDGAINQALEAKTSAEYKQARTEVNEEWFILQNETRKDDYSYDEIATELQEKLNKRLNEEDENNEKRATVTYDEEGRKLDVLYKVDAPIELSLEGEPTDTEREQGADNGNVKIISQPQDTEVLEGYEAEFSVTATVNGNAQYQWYYNSDNSTIGGERIAGATQNTYVNPRTNLENDGYYYCEVISNYAGTTTRVKTNAAKLTVIEGIKAVTISPTEVTIPKGKTLELEASTSGAGTITYKWYKNENDSNEGGRAVSDATTNNIYEKANMDESQDAGYYYCVVTQTYGTSTRTVISNTVKVVVINSEVTYEYGINQNYLAGTYSDTGYNINWSNSFTIDATVNVPEVGKRYLIAGSLENDTIGGFNIEINGEGVTNDTLRVYMKIPGSNTHNVFNGKVYANEDVKVTFNWNADTHTYNITAIGTQTNIQYSNTFEMTGLDKNTLRIGCADYRENTSTFNSLTVKSFKIIEMQELGNLRIPVVDRIGWTFNGWYTAQTEGTQITGETQVPITPTTYYAQYTDGTLPRIASVNPSGVLDIENYVDFTAIDNGIGIDGYNITTIDQAPTTWIPVVDGVEEHTETKYQYDVAWARVFHHNSHWGNVYYSNEAEAKSADTVDKYSVLGSLEKYKDNNNQYEFLLQYPQISTTQYNRWKQAKNPVETTIANDESSSSLGYSDIDISWNENHWGGLALSTAPQALIDGSPGKATWGYAIGTYNKNQGGMPGPNNLVASVVNLWSVIDNAKTTPVNSLTRRLGDLTQNGTYYIWVKDVNGNVASQAVEINKVDKENPIAEITSTNKIATSQTVTLTMGDNNGVVEYYWGTSDPSQNDVTWENHRNVTNTTEIKTVDTEGTYYLGVKDFAGNITVVNKTFYKTTLNPGLATITPTTIITMEENSINLPDPTAVAGYDFNGWFTEQSGGTVINNPYTPTSSTLLYAQHNAGVYTVSFAPNGGNVSPANKTVTYNQAYGELPTPTREEYEFLGWKINGEGDYVTSSTKVVTTNDHTLIAQWRDIVAPTVIFGTNGNSTPSTKASTSVTVVDNGSGVNESTFKFLWTTRTGEITSDDFRGNTSGSFIQDGTVELPSGNAGDYYLYIYAEDNERNSVIGKSNQFIVGDVQPEADITLTPLTDWGNTGTVINIKPYAPTVLYDNGYISSTSNNWNGPDFPTNSYSDKKFRVSGIVKTNETADTTKNTSVGFAYTNTSNSTITQNVYTVTTGTAQTEKTFENMATVDTNYSSNLKPYLNIDIESGASGYNIEYKNLKYEFFDYNRISTVTVNGEQVILNNEIATYTAIENGTYTIELTDIYGNTRTYIKAVGNVDITPPIISANNIIYTQDLNIAITDDESGVNGWQVTNSSTAPTSGWEVVTPTSSVTVTQNDLTAGKWYVWAKDVAGNVVSKEVIVYKHATEITVTPPAPIIQGNTVTFTASVSPSITGTWNVRSSTNAVRIIEGNDVSGASATITYQGQNVGDTDITIIFTPSNTSYDKTSTLFKQTVLIGNYSVTIDEETTYYETMALALAAVPDNGTIKQELDYDDESIVTVSGKNVIFDNNGKTLTKLESGIIVNSDASLTITGNGTITKSAEYNLILNRGTLNIAHTGMISDIYIGNISSIENDGGTINKTGSGTIRGSSSSVISSTSLGTVNITSGLVSNTGSGEILKIFDSSALTLENDAQIISYGSGNGIHVDNGNVTITGGIVNSKNIGIDCSNSSNITVTGGEIIGDIDGINLASGTVNIGSISDTFNTTTPSIIGGTYGIDKTGGIWNFYNGILKGKTAGYTGGNPTQTRSGYGIATGTEGDYKTAFLKLIPTLQIASTASVTYEQTNLIPITYNGDGMLSSVSSDTSIVTTSISGTNATINGVNMGSATITVSSSEGTNYLPATATCTVTVNKTQLSVTDNTQSVTYDGNAHSISLACNVSGTTIWYSTSTVLSASNYNSSGVTTAPTRTNAGSTTVYWYVDPGSNTNYSGVSGTSTIRITKANINPTVTMAGYTYGGTKSTPRVSGNLGGGTVTYYYKTTNSNSGGTAWSTVTNATSLNAGTYYMYATVAASTNYNQATSSAVRFVISKATPTLILSATDGSVNYNETNTFTAKPSVAGTLKATSGNTANVTITGGASNTASANTAYTITYKGVKATTTAVNITVTLTPSSSNYNSKTVTYSVTKVNKIANTLTVSGKNLGYNGKNQNLVSASAAHGSVYYCVGTQLTSSNYSTNGSTTIPTKSAVGTYTVYYYTPGDTNYKAKSGSVSTVIGAYSITSGSPTYHITLSSAVSKCTAGGTVKALVNTSEKDAITINKNLTINTNGKTLTRTAGTITVSGGTVTMSGNGTFSNTVATGSLDRAIDVTGGTFTISGTTTLQSKNNTLVASGGNITISSGTVKNTATSGVTCAVGSVESRNISVTISGGTISGRRGIFASAGTLTITGGTISASGDSGIRLRAHSSSISCTASISNASITNSGDYGLFIESGSATVNSGAIKGNTTRNCAIRW